MNRTYSQTDCNVWLKSGIQKGSHLLPCFHKLGTGNWGGDLGQGTGAGDLGQGTGGRELGQGTEGTGDRELGAEELFLDLFVRTSSMLLYLCVLLGHSHVDGACQYAQYAPHALFCVFWQVAELYSFSANVKYLS